MASFKFKRLPILDNLEIFSSENECSYFPFHFHDVFCISLITKGVEQFTTKEDESFALCGNISITHPGEVHQNKSTLSAGYSYKTIYASPDFLAYLNGGKPVGRIQRVIENPELFTQLNNLVDKRVISSECWGKSILLLLQYQEKSKQIPAKNDRFELINKLADQNKDERICTKELASLFHMSPYHFIREFKRAKGVTPQTFIMLKRLQKVKKDVLKASSLKDIAWANGFFDVSHLNYSFKRFFGVSICTYRNSNILH